MNELHADKPLVEIIGNQTSKLKSVTGENISFI